MVDRPFADFRLAAGQREKLGMSPRRADRHGTEIVNAVDLDRARLDHAVNAGDEVHAEVVTQLEMVEAQGEDFLNHLFAARVAAGIPSRCKPEDHVFRNEQGGILPVGRNPAPRYAICALEVLLSTSVLDLEARRLKRTDARPRGLPPLLFAGLLKVPMGPDLTHDPFFIQLLLQAAQRLVH